jgi:hypothetical protein
MKMMTKTSWLFALAFSGAVALGGCSSSSSTDDGGTTDGDTTTDSGSGLFALTVGDSCFDVLSVVGTPDDGCDLGVGDTVAMMGLVGASLPFNYDMTAATITVGTNGILGGGPISNNMATLVHDAAASDSMMTTCTWHENVNSTVTVTAQNAITISVVRKQSMFAAAPACTAGSIPPNGMCTSTWTWKMAKGTKTPPCTM